MELNSLLTKEFHLIEKRKKALEKLNLKTIKDILFYFPSRYETFSEVRTISDAKKGDRATFQGQIFEIKSEKTPRQKKNITEAILNDGTGIINLVWFHQPFIPIFLKNGDKIVVRGKIQLGKNGKYLANPFYEKLPKNKSLEFQPTEILPVYPETKNVSSRWFRFALRKITNKIHQIDLKDPLPEEILKRYKLPSLKNALIYIHRPKELKDAEAARKRFAFEEIFYIQISRLKNKIKHKQSPSFSINPPPAEIKKFIEKFPFKLTSDQKRAINQILKDIKGPKPMSRLLEGDVGSGKTAIAATIAFAVYSAGYQTAYMAPTEVLARQLFENFIKYFKESKVKIGLITSSECRKFPSKINPCQSTHISKNQFLKWVENGEIDIVIGTHSLIQEKVKFSAKGTDYPKGKNLALVIIDEQHRFGVNQRAKLVYKNPKEKKQPLPHLLSMTATPIPRTLALTIYGDLDLSVIEEMPPGRKKVITQIIPPSQRELAYEKLKEEIKKRHQAFVICPRIEPEEKNLTNNLFLKNMKAVKNEYERLAKEVFKEFKVEMLHGKMKPKEKEKIMENFREGKIDILVATSVVEVGIDVPKATIIIIENAERFGLAQLHQLRGRVARSIYQSYCFIFTQSNSVKTIKRLEALKKSKNGFELAEYDLKIRGAGELSGKKQWGISDIGMEALKNIKMVEAARTEAQKILNEDPELKKYPILKEKISEEKFKIHFE